MPVVKHEAFLRRHPVFTGKDLAAHLASRGNVGQRGQESLLAYYTKTGRVVRIRGGLYAVIPPGFSARSYPIDPFLIASRLTRDAVLSHHTALEFHGIAYSVWQRLVYSSSRPTRQFMFRSNVFRGTKFPEALIRSGTERFGVLTRDRVGLTLSVTSLERTLVDVLDRPDLSGEWEEIWRSLESVEFFDVDKVVEYVLLLGNATTAAKTGFFFDQHRDTLTVEEYHLKALRDRKPRRPHYLDRSKRKNGCLVADWNLVIPKDILERSWGEVL